MRTLSTWHNNQQLDGVHYEAEAEWRCNRRLVEMWGICGKFVWWLNIIPMQSTYIVYHKFISLPIIHWRCIVTVFIYMWSGFLHVIRFSTCDPNFYMWSGFLHVIRISTCDPVFVFYMWSGFLHVIQISTCDPVFTQKKYTDNQDIAKTLSNIYKLQFIIWLRKSLLTRFTLSSLVVVPYCHVIK